MRCRDGLTEVGSNKHLLEITGKTKDDSGPGYDGEVDAEPGEVENVLHAGPTEESKAAGRRGLGGVVLGLASILSDLLLRGHNARVSAERGLAGLAGCGPKWYQGKVRDGYCAPRGSSFQRGA